MYNIDLLGTACRCLFWQEAVRPTARPTAGLLDQRLSGPPLWNQGQERFPRLSPLDSADECLNGTTPEHMAQTETQKFTFLQSHILLQRGFYNA